MNEQANAVLVALLEKAVAGVDGAIEFSQAQIPDVIEQLLMWHLSKSVVFSIVGLLILLVCIYAFYYVTTRKPEPDSKTDGRYKEDFWFTVYGSRTGNEVVLLFLLLPVGLALVLLTEFMVWLQILIAPKIFLLEYAAALAK